MKLGMMETIRGRFASSLRLRVLTLTLAVFVAVSLAAAISLVFVTEKIVATLGTMVAERQIHYDRFRGLEALRREMALAETLMRSPTIIDWAQNEDDPLKRERGISELEHFRQTFRDRSYFFVVDGSGNYYFNDQNGTYTGAQRRYAVDAENADDAWYFKTVAGGAGCHLNVNHDVVLGVTKVWMNCVVEQNGEKLGVVGTGIDLTHFLREVVETNQRGVETVFVDASGAVQAMRDEAGIDFRSVTKELGERKTFSQLLDTDADREKLASMMRDVGDNPDHASAQFMNVNGQRMLVGVGHLAELGWHNISIMDVEEIIGYRLFSPIAFLIALATISAAALVSLLFKRKVLDRLARAENAVRRIEAGDYSAVVADGGSDEISRLSAALDRMAQAVGTQHATLEAAVRERTEQLERIAYVDQLSGVLNRRGVVEAFYQNERRRRVDQLPPALLLLDIDNFKHVNDSHGHAAGDIVIAEVARRLLEVTRRDDLCARWGGDEFVVILKNCDATTLALVGNKILNALNTRPIEIAPGEEIEVGTSIGAHLVREGDNLESAATSADLALYEAKRQGRGRMAVSAPTKNGGKNAAVEVA